MNAIIIKRSVLAAIIGSSMALGLGVPSTAHASQPRNQKSQEQRDRQDKRDEDAKAAQKAERQQQADARVRESQATLARSQESSRRQADPAQRPQNPQPGQVGQPQQRRAEQQQQRLPRDENADRLATQRDGRNERAVVQQTPREDRTGRMAAPPLGQPYPANRRDQGREAYGRDSGKNIQGRERDRLPEPQRQKLITQQRQQAEQFSRQIESRRADADRYGRALQKQHRNSQYRYQQEYYDRSRHYQSRYNWRTYNYYNDPYFYTAPRYRYYRGGSYFSINIYGANLLQQAINFGYSEGLRAGRADRMDGWRFDYRSSYAYRDANYGYYGFYVDQSEYNYYFRQGFERGYADGYYGRRRYGRYYNGADILYAPVMSTIFSFQIFN